MATSEQAALLDELMGKNRNALPDGSGNRNAHWSDEDVCKHFICGFCPSELFTNTKADLGPCENEHDEKMQESYLKSSKCGKMGYEKEFVRYLNSLLIDVERRIRRGHARLNLNSTMSNPNGLGNAERKAKLEELTDKINELVAESEKLGTEGNVEKAQAVLKQCEQLKFERGQLEEDVDDRTSGLAKELEVCEICGAFRIRDDAPQRIEEHLIGKMHLGYARIRDYIRDYEEKENKRRDDENKQHEREKNTERSRDKSKDRRSSRKSRSRSREGRSRANRSQSNSRRDQQSSRARRDTSRDRKDRDRYRGRDRDDQSRGTNARSRSRDRDHRRVSRDRDTDRKKITDDRDRRSHRDRDVRDLDKDRKEDRSKDEKRSQDRRSSRDRDRKDRRREDRDKDHDKEKRGRRSEDRDRDRRDRRSSKDRDHDRKGRRSQDREKDSGKEKRSRHSQDRDNEGKSDRKEDAATEKQPVPEENGDNGFPHKEENNKDEQVEINEKGGSDQQCHTAEELNMEQVNPSESSEIKSDSNTQVDEVGSTNKDVEKTLETCEPKVESKIEQNGDSGNSEVDNE